MANLSRLTSLIAQESETLGFEMVRVKLTGQGLERTLQVMAEDPKTGQLVVGQCAQLSRGISAKVDEIEDGGEVLIDGAYHLEVSSPGIDRPLTRVKDYANWAGHEARISLTEKLDGMRKLHGELVGIENNVVTIEDKKAGTVAVPLDNIHAAHLVLTDKLIAATVPLDSSGAEEFENTPEVTLEQSSSETPDANSLEEKA